MQHNDEHSNLNSITHMLLSRTTSSRHKGVDFVIGNLGAIGSIDIDGNCFNDNTVGVAPVVNWDGGIFDSSANSGSLEIDNRTCQYLADFSDGVAVCTDYERGSCSLTTAPSFAPSNAPTFACIDNLLEIDAQETSPTLNVSSDRTYQLCSNTIFDVDTQAPLAVRPNVRFVCGEDGISDDDCIISDGDVQVFSSLLDDYAPNVTFQGITFVGARIHSVALLKPSEVRFIDCIFRVSCELVLGRIYVLPFCLLALLLLYLT